MISDLLNPDTDIRASTLLQVVKRDGTVIPVSEGGVILKAGTNISLLNTDQSTEDIQITVDQTSGSEDPYYRQKFNDLASLVEGSNPTYDEPGEPPGAAFDVDRFVLGYRSYDFTDLSMWISTVNGIHCDESSGDFFLGSQGCTNFGAFEQPNQAEASEAYLQVLDICLPCKDCLEYESLGKYLERISIMYEYIHALMYNQDTGNPPEHPDGGVRDTCSNMYFQLITLREYWNYLVHKSMTKFAMQASGPTIALSGYYKNISSGTVSGMSFVFEVLGIPGLTSESVSIIALVRDLAGSPTKLNAIIDSSDPEGITITMVPPASGDVPSGYEVYADVGIILQSVDLTTNAIASITAKLTVLDTHLIVPQVHTSQFFFQPPPTTPAP